MKLETCKDVNSLIEKGKLTVKQDSVRFSIPDLEVDFTLVSILEVLIQDGLKKTLSAYTASFAKAGKVPDAITETIEVWREGKYLTPSEKEKALKVAIPQAPGTKKSGHLYASRRLILEGWLIDRRGQEFAKTFQTLDDAEFETWMKSDKKIPAWLRGKLEAYDKAEAEKLLDLQAKVDAKIESLPDDDDFDEEGL